MEKFRRLALLGMQWGDEGKGKLIDALAAAAPIDYVVRYQGGHNAGHTVKWTTAGESGLTQHSLILHLLPSAIIHNTSKCVIANGVVVYLPALNAELSRVQAELGQSFKERLFISRDCPLILPSHLALDQAAEAKRQQHSIGTTGRGIGPAYEDYYARRGIKLGDLEHADFPTQLRNLLDYHNFLLTKFYETEPVAYEQTYAQLQEEYAQVQSCAQLLDTVALLQEAAQDPTKRMLFEGAQGSGLDINHGTYPFVTSSATCIGGVFCGSGVNFSDVDAVVGITKIYSTRVGEGPFPTELKDEVGAKLQQLGREFGSTTGRVRRCGWLDLAYLRRAVRLNGAKYLLLTKVDVLDEFPEIKLGVAYDQQGQPSYQTLPGWQQSTQELQDYAALPSALKLLVETIEQQTGARVLGLSVGPERAKLILRGELWS